MEDKNISRPTLSSSLLPLIGLLTLCALALRVTGSFAPAAPAAPLAPLNRIASLDTGWSSRCAVTVDGAALCWGAGAYGQAGNGDVADAVHPVPVAGLQADVVEVSAGADMACARLRAGAGSFAVKCWGANKDGMLGDGPPSASSVPLPIPALHGDIGNISVGFAHACATVDGVAACWGSNWHGELGIGSAGEPISTPVRLQLPVRKVVAGSQHTCALLAAGTVRCWGDGSSGQIGDGSTRPANPTPVTVAGLAGVVDITAGGAHTCALLAEGRVACWGANWWGQLGDGTTLPRPTPVYASITSVAAVSAGGSHTCAITKAGAAYCWGDNAGGQLGDGSWADRASPTPVTGLQQRVVAISAGIAHTCAVLASGSARCWGAGGLLLGVNSAESAIHTPLPVLQPPSRELLVHSRDE